jgi:hypothetical protein
MLYREIIAVCSEIRTKHIQSMDGMRNLVMVNLVVHLYGALTAVATLWRARALTSQGVTFCSVHISLSLSYSLIMSVDKVQCSDSAASEECSLK